MTAPATIRHTFEREGQQYAMWIPNQTIKPRTRTVAEHLALTYRGKRLRMTNVLLGAKPFFDELVEAVTAVPDGPAEIQTDALRVQSYKGTQSCKLEWVLRPQLPDDEEVHEVVVEDIVDSAQTFSEVLAVERGRKLGSVASVALLDRPETREGIRVFKPDFVAFEIPNPDIWVVGFGMDINEWGRDLPHIYGQVTGGLSIPTPRFTLPTLPTHISQIQLARA